MDKRRKEQNRAENKRKRSLVRRILRFLCGKREPLQLNQK